MKLFIERFRKVFLTWHPHIRWLVACLLIATSVTTPISAAGLSHWSDPTRIAARVLTMLISTQVTLLSVWLAFGAGPTGKRFVWFAIGTVLLGCFVGGAIAGPNYFHPLIELPINLVFAAVLVHSRRLGYRSRFATPDETNLPFQFGIREMIALTTAVAVFLAILQLRRVQFVFGPIVMPSLLIAFNISFVHATLVSKHPAITVPIAASLALAAWLCIGVNITRDVPQFLGYFVPAEALTILCLLVVRSTGLRIVRLTRPAG